MMDLAIIPPRGNICTYYIYDMYLFRIKPQFTNHSSRDFDSDGNETLAETKPVHVQRALQEALHLLNQGRLKGVLAVNSQLL